MIRTPPPIQRPSRPAPRWRLLGFLACVWPAVAAGQPAGPLTEGGSSELRVAASERVLWLAEVAGSRSLLFVREPGGRFELRSSVKRRVAVMTAIDRDLLVFFDDAGSYRYSPEAAEPSPERELPQGQLPLDLVGEQNVVYAIIPSEPARELPPVGANDAEGTAPEFDPGNAALSVVAYEGETWKAVAPLPSSVELSASARLRPRLGFAQGRLLLFVPAEQSGPIQWFYWDAENSRWVARGAIGDAPLTGFWLVSFSRVLTLVSAGPDGGGGETIRAYRLLGDPTQAEPGAWRAAEQLRFSELPEGVGAARYDGAVGFNQHLGLLALDSRGEGYLRFARIANPPAEPTQRVADILAEPRAALHTHSVVQTLAFALLVALLIGLFVFRRGSMIRLIELPPGCALAFHLQRLLGWLIDFAPFTLAAAIVLDVPWREGVRDLAKWGISPDPEGGLPEQKVLLWWAFGVCGHTAYMLVMELLTRRTVGKVLTRVYLLSESGRRPTVVQILTRNFLRLIELMPQFWVFAVLVLLSRNRQRMGDIFARTLVIRPVPVQRTTVGDEVAGPPDDRPSEPSGDEAPAKPDADENDSSDADGDERGSSKPRKQ